MSAWRLRGKLPLGVDATALLLDAQRADAEWQQRAAAAAAVGAATTQPPPPWGYHAHASSSSSCELPPVLSDAAGE